MKVEVTKEKGSKLDLTIEIEPEKIEEAYKKELQKICREIKLDGFRKGKAPVKMVESAVGKESIYREIIETIIPDSYSEAIYTQNLTPIAQPEFKKMDQIEEGKPFSYKLSVEVKPKIDLENYLGLELEQERKEITDTEVNQYLDSLRKQSGKLINIEEDRALQIDDYAACDYEITPEGEGSSKPNKVKDTLIKVQEYKEMPGFAENITGVKPGEEKEFNLEIPQGDKTQKISVKFKLHEIKNEVLPELNDDFAKSLSGVPSKTGFDFNGQTLEELKNQIKETLVKQLDEKVKQEIENKLLEKLMENNNVEISPAMINYEMGFLVNDFENQLRKSGMELGHYLKAVNKTFDQFGEDLKPQAERMAKIELALDCIAEKEKIEVTDDDLSERIEEIAASLKQDKDKIREGMEKNKTLNDFKYSLLRQKVIQFLTEKCKIKYIEAKE